MNMMKSLYVCIAILILSFNFKKTLQSSILKIVIKLIQKFRYFFSMDTFDYYNLILEDEKEEEEIFLYKKLGLFSYYFDLSIGKDILKLISHSNTNELYSNVKYNFQKNGIKINGTLISLNLEISNPELLLELGKDGVMNNLKLERLYKIFHSQGVIFMGKLINENSIFFNLNETEFTLLHNEYCKRISKLVSYLTYIILYNLRSNEE